MKIVPKKNHPWRRHVGHYRKTAMERDYVDYLMGALAHISKRKRNYNRMVMP